MINFQQCLFEKASYFPSKSFPYKLEEEEEEEEEEEKEEEEEEEKKKVKMTQYQTKFDKSVKMIIFVNILISLNLLASFLQACALETRPSAVNFRRNSPKRST